MDNLPFCNEKELLLRLRQDDESAFETLYKNYSPRLLGALIKLVKSKENAAEILQQTFIKVWNHRHNLDAEKSFRSYLFRIAENGAFDFFRRAARDRRLREGIIANDCYEYEYVEEALTKKEDNLLLQLSINGLPPQRRQIFTLVKLEGKSYNEVSHLLNVSPSTISDHVVKATKSLRKKLTSFGKPLFSFLGLLGAHLG